MELRDALVQISEIREQMARAQVFRGYRSVITAISGGVALVAAALQPWLVPDPAHNVQRYVCHWAVAAGVSLTVVAVEMIVRARRSQGRLQPQLTLLAVEQFMPSIVAGALLTYVIVAHCAQVAWMLPGLWLVLFSLGIFASCRLLPRATFYSAGFYLLAGLVVLAVSSGGWAFSPWLMGGPFVVGQAFTAGILYQQLERRPEGGS